MNIARPVKKMIPASAVYWNLMICRYNLVEYPPSVFYQLPRSGPGKLIAGVNGLPNESRGKVAVLPSSSLYRLEYLDEAAHRALNQGLSFGERKSYRRLDVGDVMTPHGLDRQFQVLKQHSRLVLVTSDVSLRTFLEPLQSKTLPISNCNAAQAGRHLSLRLVCLSTFPTMRL